VTVPLFRRKKPIVLVPRPRVDPHVEAGDRVRLRTTGASGTVLRVRGRSAVIEMDQPYAASGTSQRIYYSYPGELEVLPRVGRMGAQTLYAEEPGELPE
jgi:hypothetical protein